MVPWREGGHGQTADFDSFRAFEQRQWGRAGVTKTHVHVAAAVAGSMERGETFRQTDAKCPEMGLSQ